MSSLNLKEMPADQYTYCHAAQSIGPTLRMNGGPADVRI